MRRRTLILGLLCAMVLANCYGSFSLTRKVYDWNGEMSNKFIRSAVFWVLTIIPVYPAAAFVDVVLLNTIEFWMGENPVALRGDQMQEKTVQANGKTYLLKMGRNQIQIRQTIGPDQGHEIALIFDEAHKSWFMHSQGQIRKIVSFESQDVVLFRPDGQSERIPL